MDQGRIRVVFFSDTHLGFDYPVRGGSTRRRRGQDFFDNYQRVLDYAIDTNADAVIHGGDFFFRSKVAPNIVALAYDRLVRFADHAIPIFIVPGNHERSVLPASLFLSHRHVHVFDRPRTFSLQIGETTVAFSGFPNERDEIRRRFGQLVEQTRWRETPATLRLLCMHQTVEGATVGPADFTFRHGPDVIPMRALPNGFDGVLSGHVHRHQILTGYHPPVVYPGSIERTSFAEKDEVKGFLELSIDPSRDSRIETIFRPLPTRPMVDIVLHDGLDRSTLYAYIASKVGALDRDAIVRLKCANMHSRALYGLPAQKHLRHILPAAMNVQVEYLEGSGTTPSRRSGFSRDRVRKRPLSYSRVLDE